LQRFDFKFQRVLDFRETIEDQKKGEFAKAKENVSRQEKILTGLIDEKERTAKDFNKFKTAFDFQCYARYSNLLDNKINTQKQNVVSAQTNLQSKNIELLKAMTDKKVLEKIKEKQRIEHDQEMDKREQRFNDDFAIYSYLRGIRG